MKTLNVTSGIPSFSDLDLTPPKKKAINVKIFWAGLGYQCESPDVEDVVGIGGTKLQAIESFIEHYLLRFDEVVEVSIKE
jgi:hypothetical protein